MIFLVDISHDNLSILFFHDYKAFIRSVHISLEPEMLHNLVKIV
jgi:hypothetical protein